MKDTRFNVVALSCGKFPSVDVGEKIFGGTNTVLQQMRVEAALARVQAKAGIIPQEASDEINAKCDISLIDEDEYNAQYRLTGHPVVCLVRVYSNICENGYGQYVHFGATSQDILDTGRMVQFSQANDVIVNKTKELRALIAGLAEKYRSLVMMGRTNDQHALPITLGFKFASWADELDRSIARMEESRDRIFVGQFFGAVGTLASLEEKGLEISSGLMKEVGLNVPNMHWYASRDRLAELVSNLSILTASLGRMGNEVYNEQRSEVNELAEGFRAGKVGSSTMPHKRNPFVPARLAAYGRQVRSVMGEILIAMEATNERDTRTIYMEGEALTRAFCITDAALDTAKKLLETIEVHEDAIARNLDFLGGLIFSEALMMRLSGEFGRIEAHEMIYELAQKSINEHKNFRTMLEEDPVISARLSKDELDQIMDPAKYIGLSEYFVDKITGKAD